MYLTAEAQTYKDTIAWAAKENFVQLYKAPSVFIMFTFGDKRKHDIDNCIKLTLDSCNGVLWDDDSDIQELTIRKSYKKDDPSVHIEVTEYDLQPN